MSSAYYSTNHSSYPNPHLASQFHLVNFEQQHRATPGGSSTGILLKMQIYNLKKNSLLPITPP